KSLLRLARLIEDQGELIARLEAKNSGHPIRDVRRFDLVRTVDWFEYFAGMTTKIQGDVIPSSFKGVLNYTLREPLGVVAQIVPWNFPLMFVAWNIAPALAAGNTVILKPAEYTPLSALEIARLTKEAGFPPGAVNVVPGKGSIAGAALARHPGVDKICFTGSVEVCQQIRRVDATDLPRPTVALGGRGAPRHAGDVPRLLPASDPRASGGPRDADLPGGGLRAVHHGHAVRQGRGGGRHRERSPVRPRRGPLDAEPATRPWPRGPAPSRDGVDQFLQTRRSGLAVRWDEDERHGAGDGLRDDA